MLLLAASLAAVADTPSSLSAGDVAGAIRSRRGSVTLVNVWATWCGVCKSEFDTVDAVTEELSPRGLRVVGLAIDGSAAPVERYLAGKRTTWAQYQVPGGGPGLARAIDEVGGSFPGVIPYHLLLDTDGSVLAQWAGSVGEADLRRVLSRHLPERGGGGPSSAEVAAVEQGAVRVVLAGREGDAVWIDGWNAGVLPLETELVGGLHVFRVDGPQGRFEAERNVQFVGGAAVIDLGAPGG